MFDTIFGFMFVLIGGIVMFTVSNTMNTTVVERTIEIGTLRAIGVRRAGIRALFVTEGALLGVCGALLGVHRFGAGAGTDADRAACFRSDAQGLHAQSG